MDDPAPLASSQVPDTAFSAAFGEPLSAVLDLATWRSGEDLPTLYGRIADEVQAALEQEARVREPIRQLVFPRLGAFPGAPPGAGVYQATLDELKRVHRGVLFSGGVEACDGTQASHDTLPL